jgi:hypothetical protein
VLKQGGDANTIAVVDGVRQKLKGLFDVPSTLENHVVFDQSQFVKTAIHTLLDEGGIGLFLTSVMILVFLGSMRATVAVFFSIPLSALAAFIALQIGGSSINTMVLGGLALALSRLIDNSVVVLENIYRHLEMGEPPRGGRGEGGQGSGASRPGRDLDHRGRLLSGNSALRSEQVSVFLARPRRGAVPVCLLRGRDDGGASVLRPLHETCGAPARRRFSTPAELGATL